MKSVLSVLGATVRAARGCLDRELIARADGLRIGQFTALRVLWEQDGLTPRELSERLGVEMPTVTNTVGRMVRNALVERRPHPTDARSVVIFLTPKGVAMEERVASVVAEASERALRGFSAAESEALVEALEHMYANLRSTSQAT